MRAIRDAQSTRGAERELLYALALRCDPAKGYSCFPSYQTLANDTQMNVATLKRAAKSLEAMRMISRQERRNRSNIFYLNPAIFLEEASAKRAEKQPQANWNSPFDLPQSVPTELGEGQELVDDHNEWDLGGAR